MNRKLICFLLLIIFIFSNILIYKINRTYAYDQEVYNEVYQEYNEIKNGTTNNDNDSTVNYASFSNSEDTPIYT